MRQLPHVGHDLAAERSDRILMTPHAITQHQFDKF